jgi:hypothetical protein
MLWCKHCATLRNEYRSIPVLACGGTLVVLKERECVANDEGFDEITYTA